MDFVDWRKSPDKIELDAEETGRRPKRTSKMYEHFIEEQIRQAQERGDFDNLPGFGKPLQLVENVYAGDKVMGYNLLKSNGYAPVEVELTKEIREERERLLAKVARLAHKGKTLRTRRVPPFPGEKRAYNAFVEKTAGEYEQALCDLNRKILTLNLTAPSLMHQPAIHVEQEMERFHEVCPLF